ncbi:hypothetical protein J8L88_01015 [Aquimarina sp. MMG015]|uniref:phytanoyl-CoA dioxygenase family protein n=1 Tax=Aquimarina sp. MMG015 TaxID=2822689 RepID=UPI001B3A6646|nr:phytanoyl-CoA dioxygenase family protein [Aquimarina sp. MMG015]MBQ4801412.1 hypothetical protein [Aquimarina sp. MMG015]
MKNIIKKVGFYFQRLIKNKAIRDSISNKIAQKIGKTEIPKDIGKTVSVNSKELTHKGYTVLGKFLQESEVKNIKDLISDNLKCFDPFNPSLGEFSIDNVPNEVHVANYRRQDLSKFKEILNIANNTNVLEAVQDFLGAKPTISNINMWWSIPGKKEAKQAQLFHRDVDNYKFCKLFIYLTDVELDSGPHVYVEGSSVSKKLRKIRRYKDEEIIDVFGEDKIKYFTASKGNAFIVDTYGFHKGLLPEKETRLLLQVQYSLTPIGIEQYSPVDIGSHSYDSYINRLILK